MFYILDGHDKKDRVFGETQAILYTIYNAQAISNNDVRLSINKTYIYIISVFAFVFQRENQCSQRDISPLQT